MECKSYRASLPVCCMLPDTSKVPGISSNNPLCLQSSPCWNKVSNAGSRTASNNVAIGGSGGGRGRGTGRGKRWSRKTLDGGPWFGLAISTCPVPSKRGLSSSTDTIRVPSNRFVIDGLAGYIPRVHVPTCGLSGAALPFLSRLRTFEARALFPLSRDGYPRWQHIAKPMTWRLRMERNGLVGGHDG
jgi:hypothetical protein